MSEKAENRSQDHVIGKLSAYCLDELPHDEARSTAQHLMQCQHCRSEYEQIRIGVKLAQQLTMEHAPDSLWSAIEAQLQGVEQTASLLPAQEPRHPEFAQSVHDPGTQYAETLQKKSQRESWFDAPQWKLALAASVALLLAVGVWFALRQRDVNDPVATVPLPEWKVARLEGQPKIGALPVNENGKLRLGESLMTDSASRAYIRVGDIGEVEIGPDSQVKFVAARDDNHRLALGRGKLHALIWAPPRQFYVDTPSAVAVDLGCAYTLEVNDDGQSLLKVETGWVAFEWEGRESFVPADAACVTRPGFGPGTPYFNDAPETFRSALHSFDTAGSDTAVRATALKTMLAQARKRDGLTLWHLLMRTSETSRAEVYDRLASLIAPPAAVTRDGILRGEKKMLDVWWEKLDLGSADFWREWKGPVPK